jgi:hypothetical protein
MRRFIGFIAAMAILTAVHSTWADDQEAKAVVDKAVKALGGAAKLGAIKAVSWKSKGKITFNGNENEFSSQVTLEGLDHFRQEFEGDFNGNPIKGVTIVAGDKGWRKFGDDTRDLENDALANQKRTIYLMAVPMTVLPLKGDGFKLESATEEKIGDKPAVAIKATGPDGKEFTLYFDKSSGLPVKQVAKVVGRGGEEFTQESTFADYKDFDGIKRATKLESKRNGDKFIEQQISDFKVLDKTNPAAFAKPE